MKRIVLYLTGKSLDALSELEQNHVWGKSVKTNTIVRAAILAFLDMPDEKREEYINDVKFADGRRYYNHRKR